MIAVNDYQLQYLQKHATDPYAHTKYTILLDYLRPHGSLDILNVGCGSGELSFLLADAGHRVTSIDPTPEHIEIARQHAAALKDTRSTFEVASAENYAAPRLFECAVSTDVLEHIEDDRTAFAKMAAHVRPGGVILITVPAGQWLFGYHDETIGHFRRYNRTMLRTLVEPWCAVEKIRYFGFSLIPVCYLYSKVLRKPYPAAEAGDSAKSPVKAAVVRSLLRADKAMPMPLGTSLLMKGRRR